MNGLTEEQVKRMEENRLRAIRKRKAAQASAEAKSQTTRKMNAPFCKEMAAPVAISASPSLSFAKSVPVANKKSSSIIRLIRGKCVLISTKRFIVEVGFNERMVQMFKSMPSRMYDMKNRNWNFDVSDHDRLMQSLKAIQHEVVITPLPKFVLKILETPDKDEDLSQLDLSCLDPVLRDSLMVFQKKGVQFGISREGRLLIADDMGLGKTIQALGIADYYRSEWPLLIVSPSSVRYSWLEALKTWIPSVRQDDVNVLSKGNCLIGTFRVYITSYDLMTRMKDVLASKKFKVAIMDESHFLKNYKSARTKAAIAICENVKRIILLSGTPALSRPLELYTQINMIDKKLFPKFQEFGLRYCDGRNTTFGWNYNGSSNTYELLLIMKKKLMIRRLKADVIKELPQKMRQLILLDPAEIGSNKVMTNFDTALSQMKLKGAERRGTLLSYFQETAKAKSGAVCNYVEDLLEKGEKFLCFAHHQCMLDAVCETILKKKCRSIRIDGSTPSEMRKNLCDEFQQKDDIRVAVLSISAANAGLTLTAAQLVVFAELFWNPGILTQAEDRVHRIGQENSVLVQYLVAKGTADDYLWLLLRDKLQVLNKVGLSKDDFNEADTIHRSHQLLLDCFLESDFDDDTFESGTKRAKTNF